VIGVLIDVLAANPANSQVIVAMKRLGDRTCLPVLTRSLGWRIAGQVQTRAGKAIAAIGGRQALGDAVMAVLRDPQANAKRAAYLAGRLRLTEAVPELIAIVRDGRPGERAAAASLAALGATQAAPTIAQALERTPDKYWSARVSLIGSLLRLDPQPALDELIRAVRNRQTRDIAMNALARCSDPRATALVATALLHGVIRMELVRPLAQRGDPGAADVLVHVVNTTQDRAIRHAATRGILKAAQADPHQVDTHLEWLSRSASARTASAWLEGRRTPRPGKYRLNELTDALHHTHERVRAQAVKSLALISTPDAYEIIRAHRHDPSRHVRACVAGALRASE
jgi:HEAT repeat protein